MRASLTVLWMQCTVHYNRFSGTVIVLSVGIVLRRTYAPLLCKSRCPSSCMVTTSSSYPWRFFNILYSRIANTTTIMWISNNWDHLHIKKTTKWGPRKSVGEGRTYRQLNDDYLIWVLFLFYFNNVQNEISKMPWIISCLVKANWRSRTSIDVNASMTSR